MRPQSIQHGDDLSRYRAAILMPRQHNRDRVADRHRDQRSGPVADAVFAVKVAIDVIGCNLLLREKIKVGDEARMIEGDGGRQIGIALAPSLVQEQRHERIIFDGIDRARVSVAHAEQKSAVAADRRAEFAEQCWPKRRYQSRLVDAVDQGFEVSQLISPLRRDTIHWL